MGEIFSWMGTAPKYEKDKLSEDRMEYIERVARELRVSEHFGSNAYTLTSYIYELIEEVRRLKDNRDIING